jgi:eukaryotic-like serine/threonine-protein kinase
MRLLSKRPEERYADAQELLVTLARVANAERESEAWKVPLLSLEQLAETTEAAPREVEEARPPEAAPAPPGGRGRGRMRYILLAGLALMGLLVLFNPKGILPVPSLLKDPPSRARVVSGWKLALAWMCATSGLGCPAAQVRPQLRPRLATREPCPPEVRRAMFEVLGLSKGMGTLVQLDIHQPGDPEDRGLYRTGPIVGRVMQGKYDDPALPDGSLLYGHIWTENIPNKFEDEYGRLMVVVRYTEVLLPDGRKLPVCIALGNPGTGHWQKDADSKPGTAKMERVLPATPVSEWVY